MRRSEVRERVLKMSERPRKKDISKFEQKKGRGKERPTKAIIARQLFPRAKARDRGWARLLDLGSQNTIYNATTVT